MDTKQNCKYRQGMSSKAHSQIRKTILLLLLILNLLSNDIDVNVKNVLFT